jgi:hypothetical protein
MPKGSGKEPPSYLVAGDRRSLELIFQRMDFATNALIFGDYDNAMENIEAAWQRLPNRLKEDFEEPNETLKIQIDKVPTESQLWDDPNFMATNPGWKDIERFRENAIKRLIHRLVYDCINKYTQAMDTAGLYMRESGEGTGVFGSYDDAIKGRSYKVKQMETP